MRGPCCWSWGQYKSKCIIVYVHVPALKSDKDSTCNHFWIIFLSWQLDPIVEMKVWKWLCAKGMVANFKDIVTRLKEILQS